MFAVWALLSVDPTSDFLALACGGFALFLAPWVGGFTADSAAWTGWVCGAIVTVLGVVGYMVGDRLDFATVVKDDAATRYRERFR